MKAITFFLFTVLLKTYLKQIDTNSIDYIQLQELFEKGSELNSYFSPETCLMMAVRLGLANPPFAGEKPPSYLLFCLSATENCPTHARCFECVQAGKR